MLENRFGTELIQKRDIANSISSVGTIETSTSKNISSTLTGSKIKTVNVKEGQTVQIGDVICTFDTDSIQTNLNLAKATQSSTVAQANLGVETARRNLSDAIANRDSGVSASNQAVQQAKTAYDNAVSQVNQINNQITEIQNQITNLEGQYTSAKSVETDYNQKKLNMDSVSSNYNSKKAEIDAKKANGEDTNTLEVELTNLQIQLNTAQSVFYSAEAVYNQVNQIITGYESLQNSLAELNSSKTTLDAQVQTLKNTYDNAVSSYNQAVSSGDSTVASMNDNLTNSEIAASSSALSTQGQINSYNDQLKEGKVLATVSGTVSSVNVKPGDVYAGTAIATIDGCEELIIEAQIGEYNIPDIETGMDVLIKTDATRDEELTGKITYVASTASLNQTGASNATYKIQIELDEQNDRLRLGMNAKLSIITQKEENVWSVPYKAIYSRDDGTNYIEVSENESGENKYELDVTKGIEGTFYTQIKSDGLKEGLYVILPNVEAANSMETLIDMMGADAGM